MKNYTELLDLSFVASMQNNSPAGHNYLLSQISSFWDGYKYYGELESCDQKIVEESMVAGVLSILRLMIDDIFEINNYTDVGGYISWDFFAKASVDDSQLVLLITFRINEANIELSLYNMEDPQENFHEIYPVFEAIILNEIAHNASII